MTDWRNSPRRLVAAAAKLARQHRLGLGDARPDQDLARREQVGGRGGIVAARDQQLEIGLEQAPRPRRGVAAVGIGGDDLAEQGERLVGPAGAGIIAGEPALGGGERGGAGIVGLEQGDREPVLAFGLGLVAARLGDAGKVAADLRASARSSRRSGRRGWRRADRAPG